MTKRTPPLKAILLAPKIDPFSLQTMQRIIRREVWQKRALQVNICTVPTDSGWWGSCAGHKLLTVSTGCWKLAHFIRLAQLPSAGTWAPSPWQTWLVPDPNLLLFFPYEEEIPSFCWKDNMSNKTHFPATLAAVGGHVTQVWPIRCKHNLRVTSKKVLISVPLPPSSLASLFIFLPGAGVAIWWPEADPIPSINMETFGNSLRRELDFFHAVRKTGTS